MARVTKQKKAKKLQENLYESEKSFEAFGDKATANIDGFDYEAQQLASASKTKLEDDKGSGDVAVIRCFEFGMNPEAFAKARAAGMQVDKQALFNYHHKGIEVALWRDGLKPFTDAKVEVTIDQKAMKYKIFVAAMPRKGHLLPVGVKTYTLAELAHGTR